MYDSIHWKQVSSNRIAFVWFSLRLFLERQKIKCSWIKSDTSVLCLHGSPSPHSTCRSLQTISPVPLPSQQSRLRLTLRWSQLTYPALSRLIDSQTAAPNPWHRSAHQSNGVIRFQPLPGVPRGVLHARHWLHGREWCTRNESSLGWEAPQKSDTLFVVSISSLCRSYPTQINIILLRTIAWWSWCALCWIFFRSNNIRSHLI